MGERNGLARINIFDETAHVVDGYGKFSGMDHDEGREAVVAAFDELGLLEKVEEHDHSVMTCYRCHTKLGSRGSSEQWFVCRGRSQEGRGARVVEDGSIQFHPERWRQVYLDWLENLKDWCISRQLWWGHRIPMFYHDECGWEDASVEDIETCPCAARPCVDEDVLRHVVLVAAVAVRHDGLDRGGHGRARDEAGVPTQVLSTARDIMGLWVARMVMASMYCTDAHPFEHVIIHPTVMAADGKPHVEESRGSGVDPLRLMEDYGADGMRFGLLMQVTGAQDLKFNEAKLESSRNFANKIRNAARFVMMNLDGYEPGEPEPVDAG